MYWIFRGRATHPVEARLAEHGHTVAPPKSSSETSNAWTILSPKRSGPAPRNRGSCATIAFLQSDRLDGSRAGDPFGERLSHKSGRPAGLIECLDGTELQ